MFYLFAWAKPRNIFFSSEFLILKICVLYIWIIYQLEILYSSQVFALILNSILIYIHTIKNMFIPQRWLLYGLFQSDYFFYIFHTLVPVCRPNREVIGVTSALYHEG